MNEALTAVAPEVAGVGFDTVPSFDSVVPPSGVVPYSKPLTQFFVTDEVHGTSIV